jgi:hypothetical protein
MGREPRRHRQTADAEQQSYQRDVEQAILEEYAAPGGRPVDPGEQGPRAGRILRMNSNRDAAERDRERPRDRDMAARDRKTWMSSLSSSDKSAASSVWL